MSESIFAFLNRLPPPCAAGRQEGRKKVKKGVVGGLRREGVMLRQGDKSRKLVFLGWKNTRNVQSQRQSEQLYLIDGPVESGVQQMKSTT